MPAPATTVRSSSRVAWVRGALLTLWLLASFGVTFFARELDQVLAGWPLNFWLTAQGSVLVFIVIVMVYAWFMDREDARAGRPGGLERCPATGEDGGEAR